MSSLISQDKNKHCQLISGIDCPIENEGIELEILEVRQDKGAKTFVYRCVNQESKCDNLWQKVQIVLGKLLNCDS